LHGSRFGEFTGWSISFRATEEAWDRSGARPLRIVARANLIEVSIADRGAHVTTLGVLSRMKLYDR
ncbi:HK97 family phage prohead protease, partial [Rhizobium ruizarguesonis]